MPGTFSWSIDNHRKNYHDYSVDIVKTNNEMPGTFSWSIDNHRKNYFWNDKINNKFSSAFTSINFYIDFQC